MAVVRGMRWRGALVALLLALAFSLMAGAAAPGSARADDPTVSKSGGMRASNAIVVRMRDRGPGVRRIQRRLRISADGVFGPQTKRAVRRFQRRRGLLVDGIVGPQTRRAMGLRPFTRRSVRSPRRRGGGGGGGGSVDVPGILERIAECESGGDPTAVSAGGRYRGKYQFLRSTWESYGGRGDPAKASESHQDRIALRLYREQGTKPWPTCGRRARS